MKNKWNELSLGELCTMKYGKMPKKGDLRPDGYPIFTGYRIAGYHDSYHYKDSEIVVVARGVGGAGDIKMSPPFCYLTNISIALQIKVPNILKKFLFYSLDNYTLRGLRTGAAQPQIIIADIKNYLVKFPSYTTQQKIASILSAYDDLIENNTRRIAILEEMAQMIYREWFVKLRFPGHEEIKMVDSLLGKIPEKWEVKKIKDYGEVVTGKTPPKKNKDYYGGDFPFIKTPDMNGSAYVMETGDHLSETGALSQKKKFIPPGSVLVSCIGTLGVVALTRVDSQTNQQINSIIPTNRINSFYLYIKCKSLTSQLNALGSSGATMGNVNKHKFEEIDVLYPGETLLEKFGKFCEPTFNQILNLLRRTQVLRETRDLLLPKLISGELDVSDLDIEIPEIDEPELQGSAGGIK